MANMIELERIVDFYDVAMSIFKLSEERYFLDTYESSLRRFGSGF